MGIVDTWIVYKFIKLLTTPWDETPAFKQGVIDSSGKRLIDVNKLTAAQSDTYTLFDRLVFNIKRLIEKLPGGKSKIARYAAALYLIREQMSDEEGVLVLERSFMSYLEHTNALETDYLAEQYLPEEPLSRGLYRLVTDTLDIKGDVVSEGTVLVASQSNKPAANVLGIDVYILENSNTGKFVAVSRDDIREV